MRLRDLSRWPNWHESQSSALSRWSDRVCRRSASGTRRVGDRSARTSEAGDEVDEVAIMSANSR